VLDGLAALGLTWSGSQATFYVWVRVPDGDDLALRDGPARRGTRRHPGSRVRPGGEGWIRLALVPDVTGCREAMDRWRPRSSRAAARLSARSSATTAAKATTGGEHGRHDLPVGAASVASPTPVADGHGHSTRAEPTISPMSSARTTSCARREQPVEQRRESEQPATAPMRDDADGHEVAVRDRGDDRLVGAEQQEQERARDARAGSSRTRRPQPSAASTERDGSTSAAGRSAEQRAP
jgi:hypothetical protein